MAKAIPERHERTSIEFIDKINRCLVGPRMSSGLDKRAMNFSRATKAIAEEPLFDQVLERIKMKPRKETLL